MKLRMRIWAALLIMASLVTACGVEGPGEGVPQAIDFYQIHSGNFSQQTRDALQGTGTVYMLDRISATPQSYHLRIELLADNSSVTLVTYSPYTNLDGGISLEFSTPNSFDVEANLYGETSHRTPVANSDFTNYFQPDKIDVYIDSHISGNRGRFILWHDLSPEFDLASSRIDSDEEAAIPTGGLSLYNPGDTWGLILVNAKVTFAQLGEAKLEN